MEKNWLMEQITIGLDRLKAVGLTPRMICLFGCAHFMLGAITSFFITAFLWHAAIAAGYVQLDDIALRGLRRNNLGKILMFPMWMGLLGGIVNVMVDLDHLCIPLGFAYIGHYGNTFHPLLFQISAFCELWMFFFVILPLFLFQQNIASKGGVQFLIGLFAMNSSILAHLLEDGIPGLHWF